MRSLEDIVSDVAPPETRSEKLSREMEHGYGARNLPPVAPSYNLRGGMAAGMADDLKTRIRAYARARFPKEDNPERRYGVMSGEIVYRDDDGNWYREGSGIQGLPEAVSRGALPAIGATAGGLLGGALGAGLGGAAGEGIRKNIAGWAMDEPQTMGGWSGDVATEGLLSGGGWKLGELLGQWRNAARARDITPAAEAQAGRMRGLAEQYLGDERWLTPGEAGDIASLQRQQTMLGMSADTPGDLMRRYNQERAAAVSNGVERFIGQTPNAAVAGRAVKDSAQEVLSKASSDMTKTADPYYTAARQTGAKVTGTEEIVADIDRELINAKQPIRASLQRVRNMFFINRPGGKAGEKVLDDSVDGLYQAKTAMDAMLEKNAKVAVDRNTRRLITGYKKRLMALLEEQSPDIKKGADVYRTMGPEVEEMRNGILGILAEVKPKGWSDISTTIFNPAKASPDDVRLLRSIVRRKNPRLWDNFVRSYWRETWELTPDKTLSAGARWRDQMFSTPRARQIWQAALGKDDFKTFSDFMDVLEATGRVSGGQSITHFAGEEARRQELRAAPLLSAARDVGRLDPLKLIIARARDRLDESVAKLITSPDAMRNLRQLRALPKSSERALEITAMALVRAGVGVAEDMLAPTPRDQLPAPLESLPEPTQ